MHLKNKKMSKRRHDGQVNKVIFQYMSKKQARLGRHAKHLLPIFKYFLQIIHVLRMTTETILLQKQSDLLNKNDQRFNALIIYFGEF